MNSRGHSDHHEGCEALGAAGRRAGQRLGPVSTLAVQTCRGGLVRCPEPSRGRGAARGPHGWYVPRAGPGSPLPVLQLPARARPAVRELQGIADRPVRAAAAAVWLRAGKLSGCFPTRRSSVHQNLTKVPVVTRCDEMNQLASRAPARVLFSDL